MVQEMVKLHQTRRSIYFLPQLKTIWTTNERDGPLLQEATAHQMSPAKDVI